MAPPSNTTTRRVRHEPHQRLEVKRRYFSITCTMKQLYVPLTFRNGLRHSIA